MSKRERISQLEADVAMLKVRLELLESQQTKWVWYPPQQSQPFGVTYGSGTYQVPGAAIFSGGVSQ